jgi:hypothetical protein
LTCSRQIAFGTIAKLLRRRRRMIVMTESASNHSVAGLKLGNLLLVEESPTVDP